MSIVAAILLTSCLVVGWFAQLVGMPGNWLIVAAAAIYAWFVSPETRTAIGWNTVIVLAVLAVLGEVVELAAGAMGVAQVGGSRRGAVLAIAGSIVGSLVGVVVGLPIPLIGSLVAAVLVWRAWERWSARCSAKAGKVATSTPACEVGKAAFVGRILGTVAKMIVSSIMVALALAAMFVLGAMRPLALTLASSFDAKNWSIARYCSAAPRVVVVAARDNDEPLGLVGGGKQLAGPG